MTLFYYIKTAYSYKSTIINQYMISSIKDFKLKKYILNNNSDIQAQCLCNKVGDKISPIALKMSSIVVVTGT